MGYFSSLDVSASGMSAQRMRMDLISQNIANANTTKTQDGTPYRRQVLVLGTDQNAGFSKYLSSSTSRNLGDGKVKIQGIREDMSELKRVYEPDNPEADEDGYVTMPNVDIVTEMVDMISASRSYEANVTASTASKNMAMQALNIGK
jgi:flagellar basal-body rod protein FlgC